jgi:hypothetical protein
MFEAEVALAQVHLERTLRLAIALGRFRHHSDRSDFSLMLFGGTITRRESPNVTSDLAVGSVRLVW